MLSHVTPWTHQAPLSMDFSRQEYWSGLQFPSPSKVHFKYNSTSNGCSILKMEKTHPVICSFTWVGISREPKYHFFPLDYELIWACGQVSSGRERNTERERERESLMSWGKNHFKEHYIDYINSFSTGTQWCQVLKCLFLFNMHLPENKIAWQALCQVPEFQEWTQEYIP